MAELILWRHADAYDAAPGEDDLARKLTDRGQRQAERVARWLERNLPASHRIFVSEARRSEQTARYLGTKLKVLRALNPDSTVDAVLAAIDWPHLPETLVVVGHQPWLGGVVHRLLTGVDGPISIRKGALWWLSTRDEGRILVRAVVSPDLL
ncbi:MAG: histidine phosphatase family protein [Casimicrobiaceae bacterium]|nr:histidine phosphatase family protein [Casimicrobiaceae bacterium]